MEKPNLPELSKARRNSRGELLAETNWDLPDNLQQYADTVGKPQRKLRLKLGTSKLSKTLSSTLTVYTEDGHGEVHRIFHDYYAVLEATKCRVTEKAILAQHNKHLKEIQRDWETEMLILERHYKGKK